MSTTRQEDLLFEQYQAEEDVGRRSEILLLLIAELENHATAVFVEKLGNRRPDLVNEAVYKAVCKFDSFRGESKFSTWFHRVAVNVAYDAMRYIAAVADREAPLDDAHKATATTEDASISRLTLEKLAQTLEPEERGFLLDKLDGMERDELAGKYGLSVEGVDTRWHRLKKKLSSTVAPTAGSSG